MNRPELQHLTRERLRDAEIFLASGQWAGAYHMAGYALECALKSCILKLVDDTGIIFTDKKYLDKLAKCWTHDLVQLIDVAELTEEFGKARGSNPQLDAYWLTVQGWKEVSRYERKTEAEARKLFEAITNDPDGVLPWIQTRW